MIKRISFLVLGTILFVIGIAGLFLPIIPGTLLIIAAIFMVAEYTQIKFIKDLHAFIKAMYEKYSQRKHLKK